VCDVDRCLAGSVLRGDVRAALKELLHHREVTGLHRGVERAVALRIGRIEAVDLDALVEQRLDHQEVAVAGRLAQPPERELRG
jgi:hypothetical protein